MFMVKIRLFVALFSVMLLFMQSCKVENLFESVSGEYVPQLIADSLVLINSDYVLKPDDKINLSVWDHYELSVGSIYDIYDANEVYGRWVLLDKEGMANLPRLGLTKLGGMTLNQAKNYLSSRFGKFLKYPIVEVQILNKQVTILGEVKNPGNTVFEKENTSLLECIGDAGGFGYYADKKHVKLIRHSADTSYHYVLDLTLMNPFIAHNLKVQNGDVIYVPATNAKLIDRRVAVIIPFTAIVSSLILILTFFRN